MEYFLDNFLVIYERANTANCCLLGNTKDRFQPMSKCNIRDAYLSYTRESRSRMAEAEDKLSSAGLLLGETRSKPRH